MKDDERKEEHDKAMRRALRLAVELALLASIVLVCALAWRGP